MKHILLVFFLLLSTAQLFSQRVYHDFQDESGYLISPQYLIADRVSLRKDSSSNSKLIRALDIATPVMALNRNQEMDTIKGISSHWYKVVAGKDTGWVWGGFIAQETAGSNEDVSVKFMIGFYGLDSSKTAGGYAYEYMHMQIRAVRGNKQLDMILLPLRDDWVQAQFLGRKGIDGINDIVVVHQPCNGGCGCTTGDYYVFWDGKKLHQAFAAMGSADGSYSEGVDVIFPSDMEGEPGYIKVVNDMPIEVDSLGNAIIIDESYSDRYNDTVIIRSQIVSYYTWGGSKLIPASNKPKRLSVMYFNDNTGRPMAKPEDEDESVFEDY